MIKKSLSIGVFGLGYVGLVQAVCLAQDGNRVLGIDRDANRLAGIARGECPFAEPLLGDLLTDVVGNGYFQMRTSVQDVVRNTDLSFVCVGTPTGEDGKADLTDLLSCLGEIKSLLLAYPKPYTVVVRSTVPPGTMRACSPLASQTACLFVPEFLREGNALQDYRHPPKIVVGHDEAVESAQAVVDLLYPESQAPCHLVSFETAELVKYSDNCWHALKVCFANEMGALAAAFGVDGCQLMEVFVSDQKLNISPAYLKPGMPFGGSCLPKDLAAINHVAQVQSVAVPLLASIAQSNDSQLARCVDRVLQTGARHIGLWGVSFKPGTSDLRNSPALALAEHLLARGMRVSLHDENFDPGLLQERLANHSPAFCAALSSGVLQLDGLSALQQCEVLVLCHPPKQRTLARPGQPVLHFHSGCA